MKKQKKSVLYLQQKLSGLSRSTGTLRRHNGRKFTRAFNHQPHFYSLSDHRPLEKGKRSERGPAISQSLDSQRPGAVFSLWLFSVCGHDPERKGWLLQGNATLTAYRSVTSPVISLVPQGKKKFFFYKNTNAWRSARKRWRKWNKGWGWWPMWKWTTKVSQNVSRQILSLQDLSPTDMIRW